MKPLAAIALALVAATAVAATAMTGWRQGTVDGTKLRDLLGGVDYVPDRAALDELLGDDAEELLIELARADLPEEPDPGVRLRAYASLGLYGGLNVESALVQGVHEHRAARDGIDIIYLRAAMSSLSRVAGARAVPTLELVLDHANPDARAAAARALADTGSKNALPHLYERRGVETHALVIHAIEDAIRALSTDFGSSE